MFDTMTLTKAIGGFCGAFLIFLLGGFAAEFIYHEAEHKGDDHHQAYTIPVEGGDDHGEEEVAEVPFGEVFAAADAGAGEKLWRQCQACHKLESGVNATGPYLAGIVGRDVGAASGFGYSDAMVALGGQWTPEVLSDFLTNPADYVDGTKMSYRGMPDVEDRANLIAYLATVGG